MMQESTQEGVTDVRRKLHEIRRLWKENTPQQPFYTSRPFADRSTLAAFAFHFVSSHHKPRSK